MRLKSALPRAIALLLGAGVAPGASADRLASELQAIVAQTVAADSTLPGAVLHAYAPRRDLVWSGAAGYCEFGGPAPLTPDHPVRIASNTKTYVAAAALKLWEQGALDLDSPLRDHLPGDYLQLLADGGYDPAAITIRHLLTHTSGLFDYATSDAYIDRILAEPDRRWSRLEQLQGAVDWGRPYGAPGASFHYSDTGYILLGLVIEQRTGLNLALALRRLLDFAGLGLHRTWLESLEPEPPGAGDRAHQYYGALDTHPFDPSFDLYGGGGLVATAGDLALFMHSLFAGRVFADGATLDAMLADPAPAGQPPSAYRMGISVVEIAQYRAYAHEGFWGTAAAYFPDLDLSVAASVNQGESAGHWRLVERAAAAVAGQH